MSKVSVVHQQPCQVLSQIQPGAQREDLVPHWDSLTKGICNELCPCPKQLQFSLWLQWSPSSQGTNADCSALLQGSLMVTWGPAWAKEHKAAASLCLYLLAQTHIHTLQGHLRLHCCCLPNASQAGWETGAAHSVLLTCTAVMNSEPANWNINVLVNYRKEPTHSEVCSTTAWLFGMMNTHNSSRFQQEVRAFALFKFKFIIKNKSIARYKSPYPAVQIVKNMKEICYTRRKSLAVKIIQKGYSDEPLHYL